VPKRHAITHRMRVYSSTDAAVDAVRSNQVVAFLTDAATLQYFAQVDNQANLE
jgi:ABC-type amino acid transport substrate-binding protein